MDPVAVSPAQAAQALGVCKKTVYTLINSDRLESRLVGRRRLIKISSIRALLEDA
jgi:excisionase family DNA binding protein